MDPNSGALLETQLPMEELILPESLRTNTQYDEQISSPQESLTSQQEQHTGPELASRDAFIEELLRNVIQQKLGMLHHDRHQKHELEWTHIELTNAKSLESTLRSALLNSTTQLTKLEEASDKLKATNLIFAERVRTKETELKRKNLEIQELKAILNLKDKQLVEQEVVIDEMKHRIEHKTAENKALRQRLTQKEVEIDAFLEESKKSKRTIELLKYSVKFSPNIDSQRRNNERARISGLESEVRPHSEVGMGVRKLEQMEMLYEDLKSQNKRLIQRNKELVEAYWPLMSKIQRRDVKVNHEEGKGQQQSQHESKY